MFPDAPTPKRIGDYRVVRRVPSDGVAEMFVAREEGPLGFAREVTLRCVRRTERDAARAAELLREAKICAQLHHPSIVSVLGFLEEGDRYVLVLEHVEGVTLAALLQLLEARGESLPFAAAAYIASTVASAVAAAHAHEGDEGDAQPILHRSISTSVVHVTDEGEVMLGGFGLGKILDSTPDSVAGSVPRGEIAPEVMRGERATTRSDVYSVCALAYRLFASSEQKAIEVMAGRWPSLSTVAPDIPRELAATIDAGLEPDPKRRNIPAVEVARWIARVASMDEGQRTLRTLVEGLPMPDPDASQGTRARRKAQRLDRASRARHEVLRRSTSDPHQEVADVAPEVPAEPVFIESGRTSTRIGVGEAVPTLHRPALSGQRSSQKDVVVKDVKVTEPLAVLGAPAIVAPVAPAPAVVAPPVAPAPAAPTAPPPVVAAAPPPSAPAPALGRKATPALAPQSSRAREGVISPFALETEPSARRSKRGMIAAIAAGVALIVIALLVLIVPRSSPKPAPAPATSVSAASVAIASAKPSAQPSETASVTSTLTAKTDVVPPPPRKAPPDFGWLFVHSELPGRVFVAGRSRGEPNKLLLTPCGRLYVNLAKVDAKGNWRGWAAKGKTADIPCTGGVGEVTFDTPNP